MASVLFRVVRGLLASVLAGLLVAVPAVSAWADAPSNWWYDFYRVADVQAEGWTGAGVKVAVIDGQINPNLPVFQGADLTVQPSGAYCGGDAATTLINEGSVHGSNMAALLVGGGQGPGKVRGIAPKAKVTFYAYGKGGFCRSGSNSGLSVFGLALRQAVSEGNKIVTTSIAFQSMTQDDLGELAKAESSGVIVISATMNSYTETTLFPFSANGVVSVEAYDQAGNLLKDSKDPSRSMVLPEVTVVAPGKGFSSIGSAETGSWNDLQVADGSSLAAPLVAGMLAVVWQKFPKATGNQLIQSLIHNTGTTDHALQRDATGGLGYGPASLRHLLAVDPAQYPDSNPLMDKSYGKPTVQDVAAAPKSSGAASPPESQSVQAAEPPSGQASNGLLVGLLVVAGAVGVAAVAGIVLLVVVIRRSARRSRRSGAQSVEVSVGVGSSGEDDSANRESQGTTVRGDRF